MQHINRYTLNDHKKTIIQSILSSNENLIFKVKINVFLKRKTIFFKQQNMPGMTVTRLQKLLFLVY